MPFRPIVSSPNVPALGLGFLCYIPAQLIICKLLRPWHSVAAEILSCTLFLLPGFVLGLTAKRSPVMHGVLLGLLLVVVFGFLNLLTGRLPFEVVSTLAIIVATVLVPVCSLGAILGDFVSAKLKWPLTIVGGVREALFVWLRGR